MYWRRAFVITTIAVAVIAVGATPVSAAAPRAHESSCGNSRVIIEGGRPATFALPNNAGETLEVDPKDVLILRADNLPTDAAVRWSISGLGGFGDVTRPFGEARTTTVDLAEYSKYGGGLFKLDVTMLSGTTEICVTSFSLRITGFGGVAAIASVAATGITGATALLSAVYNANGIRAKLKVQVQRRRRIGWRRWVPVPAWKRTITGSIIGAITGLCATALLQQTGVAPLSLTTAFWGLVTGGMVTFGAGIAMGAIWTFIRPPTEPEAGG